jgi:hypothetical protein
MTRSQLIDTMHDILPELVGEQFEALADEDGDVRFVTMLKGALVVLVAEAFGEEDSLLFGYHIIGGRIEDTEAAAAFVAQHNQRVRCGRFEVAANQVVFVHQLFGAGVNKDTVRWLLKLLAEASCLYPELAAQTGALNLAAIASLEQLDQDD